MNSQPAVTLDFLICINCTAEFDSSEEQNPNNGSSINSTDLFSLTIIPDKTCAVLKEIYKLSLLEEFIGPEGALENNLPLCPQCLSNFTQLHFFYENFNSARALNKTSYLHEKILKLDQILRNCVDEAQKRLRENIFNKIRNCDNGKATLLDVQPFYENDCRAVDQKAEAKMETDDCSEHSSEVHSENFTVSLENSDDSNSSKISTCDKDQKDFDKRAEKSNSEKSHPNQLKTCIDARVLVKRLTRTEIRRATEIKPEAQNPSNEESIRRSSRKPKNVMENSFSNCYLRQQTSLIKNKQRISKNSGENQTIISRNKSTKKTGAKTSKKKKKPAYKRPRTYEFFHRRKQKHPYPCQYCLEDFDLEVDRTEHLKATHVTLNKSIICLPCGRLFPCNSAKLKHDPTCGQPPPHVHLPPYICEQCNKEFSSYIKLQNHRKITHAQERPFACDQCDARTVNASLLRFHKQQVHDSGGPTPCPECGKILKNNAVLQGHFKRMHTARGIESYHKTLKKQNAKKVERRREKSKNLTSVCTECDVDFQTVPRYLRHFYAVHEKQKKWQCEHCGKSFANEKVFSDHRKFVHTDERPFVCDQCGNSFKSNKNLQTHFSRSHTEEGRRRYNEWGKVNYRRKAKLREELKKLDQCEVAAADELVAQSHANPASSIGEIVP